uniref:Uncharacterized protein n=1 Tax=Oryza nivara TaxID=4536 RepID=A0A0E0FSA1_ORYNI
MTVKARVTSSCADVEASQLTSRTLLTLRLADRTKPDDEPHNANELLLPDKILLVVTIVHIVASSVAHSYINLVIEIHFNHQCVREVCENTIVFLGLPSKKFFLALAYEVSLSHIRMSCRLSLDFGTCNSFAT